jgi:hypothetical protein
MVSMNSETQQKLFINAKATFVGQVFAALFLVACFFHTAHAAEGPISFYISPDGKDTWSGRLSEPNKARTDGPFATLTRVRDAIREMKKDTALPEGQVTVWILAGTYYLTESFELTFEDGGTEKTQIVYQTTPYEQVNIIGGRQINKWGQVKDQAVLNRLNPEARGKVYQSDLKAQGIDDFGQFRSRGFGRSASPAALELFFQDKPMTVARWPNSDFLKITGYTEAVGDDHGGKLGNLAGGFNYEADRPSRWKDTNDIWVHGYWAYDWANSYEHIQSIDVNNHLIKTSPPYGNYGFRKGGRFYFINVLEELDEPGEFYLDRKNGILYFWPSSPIEEGKALVSIVEKPLININGASYVTIRGLTIECARGDGVRILGGSKNVVTDCTLRNLGNNGVTVSGGNNHGVFDCDIYQAGDGGISLSGGDRKTLLPAGHYACKNHIHNVARWSRCYVPAISVNGVGISVSNNLIHDHPHCAILFGGNEHHIELNEIHHVCMETGDVGAIYTGRDYTYRGNIIRYNFIHHTGGVGMGSMGIYMDDCVSGTQIYGNILWKLHRAVFIGGGRDFTIENNIFVDCDPAIEIDGRGLSKAPVWHDMVYQTMKKHLEDMNWKQPPYSTRYPQLADLEKFYAADDGVPPGNISVLCNICVGSEFLKTTWGAANDMIVVGDNLVGQDPNFIDAANGDFRLKDNSPAFKLGFKPLPTDQIGLKRPPRDVRKKQPDPIYAQLEKEYGKTVAQASADFKIFYRFNRMTNMDILLPYIKFGMPKTKVELLLGKPDSTQILLEDKESWFYTLFYSQATRFVFDVYGQLINVDGYGREEWRKANIDSLIPQLRKGMTEYEVHLILGPPDRVAHSPDRVITTCFYEQISPSPIVIEFDKEKLKSLSGYGKELWGKQKGE